MGISISKGRYMCRYGICVGMVYVHIGICRYSTCVGMVHRYMCRYGYRYRYRHTVFIPIDALGVY